MKVVHIALLYLGSVTFLGVDAARLDVAAEFKRKWTRWALSRPRAPLRPHSAPFSPRSGPTLPLSHPAPAPLCPFLTPLSLPSRSTRGDAAHIRVKRYRQSISSFPHFESIRSGCRFGTCTVQKLAHDIFQLTNKEKDGAAPVIKISPQGYGRRRRSLPAAAQAAPRGARTRPPRPLAALLAV
uniref:Pro-adrenomedullin n=1 Tax=Nothoprocta perdicaria TaxID=30464 RepID=A0A8C7EGA1_NOTPE